MQTDWRKHERFVRTHIGNLSIKEIARRLEVTEYDLKLYIHRERIFPIKNQIRNLAYEVVKLKFVHPEYFRPTKKFYKAIGMTQRQWWSAYRGESRLTELQYKSLCTHLGVTLQEAFDTRQITFIEPGYLEQD